MPALLAYSGRRWGRRQHRGILREFFVPGFELGMGLAPTEIAIAEIEIAERAANCDLTDCRRLVEAHAFERVETSVDRRHVARDVVRIAPLLRLNDLVAAGDRSVHDAVAQRLQAERLPAPADRLPERRRREKFSAADLIQIFADHRRIEERRTVVEHQRGDLFSGLMARR